MRWHWAVTPARLREVLDHAVVKVLAAQVRVARRRLDLARQSLRVSLSS